MFSSVISDIFLQSKNESEPPMVVAYICTQVSSVNKYLLVGQSKARPLMNSSEWDGRSPIVPSGM